MGYNTPALKCQEFFGMGQLLLCFSFSKTLFVLVCQNGSWNYLKLIKLQCNMVRDCKQTHFMQDNEVNLVQNEMKNWP